MNTELCFLDSEDLLERVPNGTLNEDIYYRLARYVEKYGMYRKDYNNRRYKKNFFMIQIMRIAKERREER